MNQFTRANQASCMVHGGVVHDIVVMLHNPVISNSNRSAIRLAFIRSLLVPPIGLKLGKHDFNIADPLSRNKLPPATLQHRNHLVTYRPQF
jgi:hypothetical protein